VNGVRRPLLASLLVFTAAAAGCAKTKEEALPPVPPTVATTSTTVIDYSTVALAPVETKTTTTVNQGPGRSRLVGRVVGPDGPVAEAVVRVERLQGDSVVFRGDVATNAEGRWETGKLVGGRWRVRAWKVPDLALVEPASLFLEAGQVKSLDLGVDRFGGSTIKASVAPDPPPVGEPAHVVVSVTRAGVDAEGIVRYAPVANLPIELFAPNWYIASQNPQATDAEGRATWLAGCAFAGPSGMFVTLLTGEVKPIALAPCAGEPPTTTTPPAGGQ
jgi:hypothetical protein